MTTVNGGWNFRVTAVAGVSIGDTCTFSGLKVQGASLGGTAGVLNYQANRPSPRSSSTRRRSATSIFVKSQFALTKTRS